jgi:colanic acid/amylovoran biosynthesis glycosyltransferase
MTDRPTLRCAYIVSRYPSMTHTFVLREVLALRARGVEVSTVTVRQPEDSEVISPADRAEANKTHPILPTTPLRILRAHAHAFWRSPSAYLRTLSETLTDAPVGIRTTAWQVFYFVEGVLLWHWLTTQRLRHVHAHHGNVGSDLAMIATRFGNRSGSKRNYTWSLTVHGPTELADVKEYKLAAKIARADAVVAISDHVRAQLMALVKSGHHGRIRKIHCGVVPSDYSAVERSFEGKRPFELLTVARLAPRKGQEVLLDALSQLRSEGDDVVLTIVGDGPARRDIELRADELGVAGAVTFVGALGRDEVPGFYAKADAFCLPSFSEGVPIVLMEAMASGLPVVATQIMGVPELVNNGYGLLVPPARADALAHALSRLMHDPELRRDLGTAGRRKVLADFTLDESVRALENLFREVASASGG